MEKCVDWEAVNYSNLPRTQPRTALVKYQHDIPCIFVLLMDDVFSFALGMQLWKFVVIFFIFLFAFYSPILKQQLLEHLEVIP